MSQYSALLSIVYMTGFVVLFDRVHVTYRFARFCKNGLLSADDVDRLRRILCCEED